VGSPARVIKKYDFQKQQWLRLQAMTERPEDVSTQAELGAAWSQAPIENGDHHRSFVVEDLMSRTQASEAMNSRHTYFAHTRKEIQPLLPNEVSRALEIGCGTGSTLLWLKGLKHCAWIGGVEVVPDALAVARKNLDAVYAGNIEQMDLPIEQGTLDLILCLDVLEHLVDPWQVVNRLKGLLKVGGSLIVSIPNIRNHKVLSLLLFRGKWDYAEAGILDRGHLRFFVRDTAIQLVESAGLKVDTVLSTGLGGSRRSRIVNALLPSLITSLFEKQYLIRGIRVD
jgi:2-polyprenyl-3-methyl-5-hydroxy-6-metoxy-1,4-benzoquinol methylase